MESIGIEIRKLMLDKKMSSNELAEKLGISRSALYKKLEGKLEFTRKEIEILIKLFEIDEKRAVSIFFTSQVS